MGSARRIVAVFAHPDDESLLAGGTLAACAERGMEVALICATRGEDGPISDPALATRATLGTVREAELRAAAAVLGLHAVEFLGYPDGMLPWVDREKPVAEITDWLRRWQPDAVITFGAEGLYWHGDHIAVHEYTRDAWLRYRCEAAAAQLYYATWPAFLARGLTEGMAARHLPSDLWGLHPDAFGVLSESISTTVNVEAFVQRKLHALRCHRTQLASCHLFSALPADLATSLLGHEYFIRDAAGPAEADWLSRVLTE